MKYDLAEHSDSITEQYLDLISDLGLDPTNINSITYAELKDAIVLTYPVMYFDHRDSDVMDTPEFILANERKKAIYVARRLYYFYQLLRERTLNA